MVSWKHRPQEIQYITQAKKILLEGLAKGQSETECAHVIIFNQSSLFEPSSEQNKTNRNLGVCS